MIWVSSRLGDHVTLQRGFDMPSQNRVDGEVPIISSSGKTGTHNEAKVKGPGIVTGRYGTIGEVFYIEEDFWPLNTTLYVKDFKGNHPRFISYLLNTIDYNSVNAKSGVPGVNRNDLHQMIIKMPDHNTQVRIVEVLSSLDEKIELNRRMNETIEQMAIAIYKHWFIDFGPFEQLGDDEVPYGWRWGTLNEIAYAQKQQVDPSELDESCPYIGLEHMPKGNVTLGEWGSSESVSSNKFRFQKGNILFGKLRPYFKKVGVAPVDGICSTDILVLKPASAEYFGMLFGQVIQDSFIDYCTSSSSGTKMPRCDWKEMKKYSVPIPPEDIRDKFNRIIEGFVQQINTNIVETRVLTEIRDYLLPRLLSGEIEEVLAGA